MNNTKTPGPLERFARAIGQFRFLPRKVRSFLVRGMAGEERQKVGSDFDVELFEYRYFGNTSSHIDWHVYFFGEYDPVGTNFLRHITKKQPDAVFLDIGANTGTHTLAISKRCKQIHCFEPSPDALEALRRNISANLIQNVAIHPFGLSSESRISGFYENKEGNLGAGTFQHQNRLPDLELPLERGDEVFPKLKIESVDLVKVDVEGHEFEVLKGIRDHLERSRPIVLWEFNPSQNNIPKQNLGDLFPSHYETFRLRFGGRWARSRPILTKSNTLSHGNYVSIPIEKLKLVEALIRYRIE